MSDKHFEREIKGKLGDYHSPLDAEALWGDLGLEEKKKDRGLLWWFFGSMAFLIVLGSSYFLLSNFNTEEEQQLITNQLPIENESIINKEENKNDIEQTIDKKANNNIGQSESKTTSIEQADAKTNNINSTKKQPQKAVKESTNTIKNLTTTGSSRAVSQMPLASHSATAAKTTSVKPNKSSQAKHRSSIPTKTFPSSTSNNQVKTVEGASKNALLAMLDKMPLIEIQALDFDPAAFKMSRRKAKELLSPLKPKSSMELMLNFNPYYAHKRLSSENEVQRQILDINKATESYQNAYSVGIGLRKSLPNGLRITGGVAFDQLTEVFRKTTNLGIETIYDSTAIDQIRITDAMIDTSFGAFKTYETIRYQEIYNRYKSISIPLSIGYVKRKERWLYYGDLGIVYNIRKWQRGRSYTAIDPELMQLNFADTEHHFNNVKNTGLHLSLGFGIGKQLNHRWRWELGPHIQHGITSWTDGWPLDIRYTNIGINGSLNFTF